MTDRAPGGAATRTSRTVAALALALLLLLLAAHAAYAAGTLSGTLRGPDGERFTYFEVRAYTADPGGGWRVAQTRTISSSDSGLPDGDFSLSLPAGSYRACFSPAGFEYAETAGTTCWAGAHELHEATNLTIDEAAVTSIAPQLPREGGLTGRVLAPGEVPVHAYVLPYRRAPDGTWAPQTTGGASTGGTIALEELDPGRYRFCVTDVPRALLPECWEDAATVADATDVVVPDGGSPAIVVRLAARASITGTVSTPVDPDGGTSSIQLSSFGAPWPGAEPRWQPVAVGSADPETGAYRIEGLEPGTYRACVYGHRTVPACWRQGNDPADGDDIVLAAGEARTGVDLAPAPAGYVVGSLPDMYLGAEGFPLVSAWAPAGNGWVMRSTAEAVPTGPGTQWSYELGSLSSGPVVVCVEHQDPEFVPAFPRTCLGESPSPAGGEPVDVTAGQTTTAPPLSTGRAGDLRGRVTGPAGPVEVQLVTRSGRVAATVLTHDAGNYRFAELPAGNYRVGFHRNAAASPFAAELWRNVQDGAGLAAATPVQVSGAAVNGINATLDPGGTLAGRLVAADGEPVAGCGVLALGREGRLAERWADTDAGGAFAIGGLSTAAYVVVLPPACSGTGAPMTYDATSPTGTSARPAAEADTVAVTRGQRTALPRDLVTGAPPVTQVTPPAVTGSSPLTAAAAPGGLPPALPAPDPSPAPVASVPLAFASRAPARTRTADRRLRFDSGREVTCASPGGACKVRASLETRTGGPARVASSVLGRNAFVMRPGTASMVRVRLRKDAVALLRARRELPATLTTSVTADGRTTTFRRTVRLVVPSRPR